MSAALEEAGLAATDVDVFMPTTVTGVMVPSLEARVAGAAGVARLHDYLRGAPGGAAVLLSVELCWLTFPRGDTVDRISVGSALFGDGSAAVADFSVTTNFPSTMSAPGQPSGRSDSSCCATPSPRVRLPARAS